MIAKGCQVFAAILALAWLNLPSAAEEPSSAARLFVLTLPALDGQPVALASYAGKPLLINFWARWCLPCRKEIPDLAILQRRHAVNGFAVIGIAVEDAAQRAAIADFAQAYDMNYLSLIAGMEGAIELMRTFGNSQSGLPFTVFIDRRGRIQSRKLGAMSLIEMEAALSSIL